jgi:hypothetical protein
LWRCRRFADPGRITNGRRVGHAELCRFCDRKRGRDRDRDRDRRGDAE